MDPIEKTISSKCPSVPSVEKNNVSIHSMGDIEQRGSLHQSEYVTVEPDDYLTVIYTSGSSGLPKGVHDVSEIRFSI